MSSYWEKLPEEEKIRRAIAVTKRHHKGRKITNPEQFENWICAQCGQSNNGMHTDKSKKFPEGVYMVIDNKPFCSSKCVRGYLRERDKKEKEKPKKK